jgi:hypothetical protein
VVGKADIILGLGGIKRGVWMRAGWNGMILGRGGCVRVGLVLRRIENRRLGLGWRRWKEAWRLRLSFREEEGKKQGCREMTFVVIDRCPPGFDSTES